MSDDHKISSLPTVEDVTKAYAPTEEISLSWGFLFVCASGTSFILFENIIFYNWNDDEKELYVMFRGGADVCIENVTYESGKKFQDAYLQWHVRCPF